MEKQEHLPAPDTQDSPMKEVFDPEKRLDEISSGRSERPKEETRSQLSEFRILLEKQKDEISSAILRIYYKSQIQKDVSEAELLEVTRDKGFSDSQIEQFRDGIGELVKQRRKIDAIKQESLSSTEQFEDIFGFKPKGDVELSYSTTGIILKCSDLDDFDKTHQLSSVGGGPTDSGNTQAFAVNIIKDKVPSEWKYTSLVIVARENSDQKTIDHEEQHKYYTFFRARKPLDVMEQGRKSSARKEKIGSALEENLVDPRKVIEDYVTSHIKDWSRMTDSQIKDEVLAYYKSGDSSDYTDKIIKSFYVNKWVNPSSITSSLRSDLMGIKMQAENDENTKILSEVQQILEMEDKVITEVVARAAEKELVTRVDQLVSAIPVLEEKGYTREEITARLYAEPASSWQNLSKRIESRNA